MKIIFSTFVFPVLSRLKLSLYHACLPMLYRRRITDFTVWSLITCLMITDRLVLTWDLLNNTINITLGVGLTQTQETLILVIVLRHINLLLRTGAALNCCGLQGSLGSTGLGSALSGFLLEMAEYLHFPALPCTSRRKFIAFFHRGRFNGVQVWGVRWDLLWQYLNGCW